MATVTVGARIILPTSPSVTIRSRVITPGIKTISAQASITSDETIDDLPGTFLVSRTETPEIEGTFHIYGSFAFVRRVIGARARIVRVAHNNLGGWFIVTAVQSNEVAVQHTARVDRSLSARASIIK